MRSRAKGKPAPGTARCRVASRGAHLSHSEKGQEGRDKPCARLAHTVELSRRKPRRALDDGPHTKPGGAERHRRPKPTAPPLLPPWDRDAAVTRPRHGECGPTPHREYDVGRCSPSPRHAQRGYEASPRRPVDKGPGGECEVSDLAGASELDEPLAPGGRCLVAAGSRARALVSASRLGDDGAAHGADSRHGVSSRPKRWQRFY